MATNSPTAQKKNQTTLPPRRGKIKAKIFESLVKTVVSTLTSNAGGGAPEAAAAAAGEASSGSVSPAPTGYNSDGSPEA